VVVAAASCLRGSRALAHEKVAWVLYAVLMVTVSREVWQEDWGFMRGAAELCVLSGVILLGARHAIVPWLAVAVTAAVWRLVALALVVRL